MNYRNEMIKARKRIELLDGLSEEKPEGSFPLAWRVRTAMAALAAAIVTNDWQIACEAQAWLERVHESIASASDHRSIIEDLDSQ